MKNWAKNLEFFPKKVFAPTSTEDVQKIVKEHFLQKKSIRVRGSSHSWMPLIATNESLLHLDCMQDILEADHTNHFIKAKAGTKLHRFGKESFQHNMSLVNQGDIAEQSLAGAFSTGTHGTGITLPSLSNQIQNMTMVTGISEILHIDSQKNSDMLNAASVSLGVLGIITELTLKMMPAYKLKVDEWTEDAKTSMLQIQSRIKENRHVELFYFPMGDWCYAKKMNITNEKETSSQFRRVNELIVSNWLYEILNLVVCRTHSYRSLDNLVRKFAGEKSYVHWSYEAFPTSRTVRFMEMEYNLPFEKFEEVFEEIKACIKKNNFQTLFPIEIRFVKGDNLWLSPAYQRDSVYFAVHTYVKENYKPYFGEIEKIFKRHGGRPHWGKFNNMNREEFEKVYPKWDDFKKVRTELDPSEIFLNSYLRTLF